jgi:hypothetical protein
MVRASEVEGSALTGPDGSVFGTLEKLLLHSDGSAVVVGAAVRPPAAIVVVARPQTFIPLSTLKFSADGVSTTLPKLPKVRDSADALGLDPDFTVIWTGMPIEGPSGARGGKIADFEFDARTGKVVTLLADGGAVANAAYGVLTVPADAIVGYSAGAVRLSRELVELDSTGGIAKAAAAAVVNAKVAVAAIGEKAGEAVVSASGATGRAIKTVKDAKVAERTADTVGKTWRDSVKAFREGRDGED